MYSGKPGTQPPDQNWIRCPCCHLKFSERSLPFHVEACIRQKSGSWEMLSCPLCNDQVRGSEFKLHLTEGCVYRHTTSSENRVPRMGNEHGPHDQVVDGAAIELVPCPHCDRRFATHRVDKHAAACSKNALTPKRKVFDMKSKRTPMRGSVSAQWSLPPRFEMDTSLSVGASSMGGGSSSSSSNSNSNSNKRNHGGDIRPVGMKNVKYSVAEGNQTSLGNPLVRSRRTAPRPTYSFH